MKLRPSFLLLLLSGAVIFVLFTGSDQLRAQTAPSKAISSCALHPVAPREVDFPYYNLSDGYESTLNLVSDSPKSLDFTLAIKGKLGQVLTTPQSIQPRAKLAIDLGSLITQLGGDPTGAFAEGSVAVYFVGTIMPLVGQVTIRNPQLSLVHESVMVEHDLGRSDIPTELDGVWWGLGGRQGRVMVSNTSAGAQTAQVYLDFQGQRHALSTPLSFLPYETKTLDISQLLASLGVSPAQAPEGGITIIQSGPQPALIANGRITDAATGFSSTIDFPWGTMEQARASALHANGLPIGTPTGDSPFAGAGTFVPHVALRNLSGAPQAVTVTIEYPQPAAAEGTSASPTPPPAPADANSNYIPPPAAPGDPGHHPEWGAGTGGTVGTLTLGPFPVGANSAVDYSLESAMSQLPLPLPFFSVRIQYSGAPASLQAQVTSVESRSNLIIDSHVQNEGNGWAGSGANPWHLDESTESILFLTNESDQPARMGFSVTANNTHYYLTDLQLGPHETRAMDLRKLRDAQLPDLKGNKIPADASDGSVVWQRLDKLPVMGRLMVINRQQGMASNYDCCICVCPADYYGDNEINPATANLPIEGSQGLINNAQYYTCNLGDYYVNVTAASLWTSAYPNIASVNTAGTVKGQSAGTTGVTGQYCSTYYGWVCLHPPFDFGCEAYSTCGYGNNTTNVASVSIIGGNNFVFVGTDPTVIQYNVEQAQGTPSGGQYSWTANNNRVTFNTPSAALVTLTGTSPSTALLDTTLTANYTYNQTPANPATRAITVAIFKFLQQSGQVQVIALNGPTYGYNATVWYNIFSNPGGQQVPSGFSGITVVEIVTIQSITVNGTPANFPYTPYQGNGATTSNAQVQDDLSVTSNSPLPAGLDITSSQDIAVGGMYVRNNTLNQLTSGPTITNNGPFN